MKKCIFIICSTILTLFFTGCVSTQYDEANVDLLSVFTHDYPIIFYMPIEGSVLQEMADTMQPEDAHQIYFKTLIQYSSGFVSSAPADFNDTYPMQLMYQGNFGEAFLKEANINIENGWSILTENTHGRTYTWYKGENGTRLFIPQESIIFVSEYWEDDTIITDMIKKYDAMLHGNIIIDKETKERHAIILDFFYSSIGTATFIKDATPVLNEIFQFSIPFDIDYTVFETKDVGEHVNMRILFGFEDREYTKSVLQFFQLMQVEGALTVTMPSSTTIIIDDFVIQNPLYNQEP